MFSVGCLLLGHDDIVARAAGRMWLRCQHCGRDTPGWTVVARLTEARASEQLRDGVGGLRLRAAKDRCCWPEGGAFHNETDPLKVKSFVRHRSPFSGASAGSNFAPALPVSGP